MAIPNMFTVRMHAQRLLRDRFDQIVDAMEPGGSGDMFEDLDPEERDALTEVTRMGFPPRSWFGHRTMGMHAFPVLYRGLVAADPSYIDVFWTEPGYLGHEAPASLVHARVQQEFEAAQLRPATDLAAVSRVLGNQPGQARGGVDTAWRGPDDDPRPPVAVRLSASPGVEVRGADLFVLSGAATGARIGALSVIDDVAVFGPGGAESIALLQRGDTVRVDNSGYLAA